MRLNTTIQHDIFNDNSVYGTVRCNNTFHDTGMYRKIDDYQSLLFFVTTHKNLTPLSAMFAHIQNADMNYATTAKMWHDKFKGTLKSDAKPIISFDKNGKHQLIFQVNDIHGLRSKIGHFSFKSKHIINRRFLDNCINLMKNENINLKFENITKKTIKNKPCQNNKKSHSMTINKIHTIQDQFYTLCLKLSQILLAKDNPSLQNMIDKKIPPLNHTLEAESVTQIICHRNGVPSRPFSMDKTDAIEMLDSQRVDITKIMKVAGQIESILHLDNHKLTLKSLRTIRPSNKNSNRFRESV